MKKLIVFISVICCITLFFNTQLKAQPTDFNVTDFNPTGFDTTMVVVPGSSLKLPQQDFNLEREIQRLDKSIEFIKSKESRLFDEKEKPIYINRLTNTSLRLKDIDKYKIKLNQKGQNAILRLNDTLEKNISINNSVNEGDRNKIDDDIGDLEYEHNEIFSSDFDCTKEEVTVILGDCFVNGYYSIRMTSGTIIRYNDTPNNNNSFTVFACTADYNIEVLIDGKVAVACRRGTVKKTTWWSHWHWEWVNGGYSWNPNHNSNCPNVFIVNCQKGC